MVMRVREKSTVHEISHKFSKLHRYTKTPYRKQKHNNGKSGITTPASGYQCTRSSYLAAFGYGREFGAVDRRPAGDVSGEVRPGGTYGGDEDVCDGGLAGLPVTPGEEDARGAGSTIRSLVGVYRFIGVYCGGCCAGPEFLRVPREYPALARWRWGCGTGER